MDAKRHAEYVRLRVASGARASARRLPTHGGPLWATHGTGLRSRSRCRLPASRRGDRTVSAADRAIRSRLRSRFSAWPESPRTCRTGTRYEVVRAHGESGVTAQLEPATIDGLVYSSSMVVLFAARHRLAVPALARWLLASASSPSWPRTWPTAGPTDRSAPPSRPGPQPATSAATSSCCGSSGPAASGAVACEPAAGHAGGPSGHSAAGLRFVAMSGAHGSPVPSNGIGAHGSVDRPEGQGVDHVSGAGRTGEPGICDLRQASSDSDQMTAGRSMLAQSRRRIRKWCGGRQCGGCRRLPHQHQQRQAAF